MDKFDKAEKILADGGVTFRGKKGKQLFFIVKGKRERYYEVKRDGRGKPKYHCNCKYFLPDECSHVIAATIYAVTHKLIEGD